MPDLANRRDPLALAFLLPQFHPIRENDEWWGAGFTEWRNVTKSRPLFPRHYQPQLPADLGFYDLRLPETRQQQADMARAAGLSGFVWYHYWFGGRRVLERPFTEVVETGEPDFPFVLCWANENWTRAWDGSEREILLSQSYSAADDVAHITSLMHVFTDPRYITLDGKPVFLVYRSSLLPEPARTMERWRSAAQDFGFPDLHLCRVDRFAGEAAEDPHKQGFDMAVEFQPDPQAMPQEVRLTWLVNNAARRVGRPIGSAVVVYDYDRVVDVMTARQPPWPRYPGVTPGWDNSARRRSGATVLHGSTPSAYSRWLTSACDQAVRQADRHAPFVFINAWNEWAEGAHLEPDQRWGRAYLDATRDVLARYPHE